MTPPMYYSRLSKTVATNGGNLPHWSQRCATFVTFRLADSLPEQKTEAYKAERDEWIREHPQPWDDATEAEYLALFPRRFQKWLDAGYGSCALRDARVREMVETTLRHFDGVRYTLYAFVVMPNHVHVLFLPEEGFDGRKIVTGWKRYSARVVNEMTGCEGTLWQKESYDHLVRNVDEFNAILSYIRQNAPEKAYDAYAVDAKSVRVGEVRHVDSAAGVVQARLTTRTDFASTGLRDSPVDAKSVRVVEGRSGDSIEGAKHRKGGDEQPPPQETTRSTYFETRTDFASTGATRTDFASTGATRT